MTGVIGGYTMTGVIGMYTMKVASGAAGLSLTGRTARPGLSYCLKTSLRRESWRPSAGNARNLPEVRGSLRLRRPVRLRCPAALLRRRASDLVGLVTGTAPPLLTGRRLSFWGTVRPQADTSMTQGAA